MRTLHRVRFARARLPVGEDADVVAIHGRAAQRADGLKHVRLPHVRAKGLLELESLRRELVARVLDDEVVVLALELDADTEVLLVREAGPHAAVHADVALQLLHDVEELAPLPRLLLVLLLDPLHPLRNLRLQRRGEALALLLELALEVLLLLLHLGVRLLHELEHALALRRRLLLAGLHLLELRLLLRLQRRLGLLLLVQLLLQRPELLLVPLRIAGIHRVHIVQLLADPSHLVLLGGVGPRHSLQRIRPLPLVRCGALQLLSQPP